MRKVKAKKHLGQHFLKDISIAEDKVNQMTIKENTILEIGPGMGVLTQFLITHNIDLLLCKFFKPIIGNIKSIKKYS